MVIFNSKLLSMLVYRVFVQLAADVEFLMESSVVRSGTETISEEMTGNGADYRGGQRYTRRAAGRIEMDRFLNSFLHHNLWNHSFLTHPMDS